MTLSGDGEEIWWFLVSLTAFPPLFLPSFSKYLLRASSVLSALARSQGHIRHGPCPVRVWSLAGRQSRSNWNQLGGIQVV